MLVLCGCILVTLRALKIWWRAVTSAGVLCVLESCVKCVMREAYLYEANKFESSPLHGSNKTDSVSEK